jgi:hypothetical protein
MKAFSKLIGLCVVSIGLFIAVNATGATINDNYIGGMYYNGSTYPVTDDVLGGANFNIDKMEVNIGSSITTIDIYTSYINHVTANDNIEFGDLFLSNNGWNPHTLITEDNYFNGEFWEFALVLDDHSGTNTSGTASLYAISDKSQYILAENTPAGAGENRMGQEVQLNTTATVPPTLLSATGAWSIFSDGIRFTIDTSLLSLGTQALGLRWTMTCANDIIEGSVPSNPVPEPATLLLFGTGIVGFLGLGRRRK